MKKLTEIFTTTSIILSLLVISLAVFRKILLSPGVIGMEGEWNIPPFTGQFKQMFEQDLYMWGGTMGSFGNVHYSSGFYYKMLLYFLSLLGMDGDAISKFISVFAMTLAGYSMFYLCRQMKIRVPSSLIAGIFYMLTPEVFNRFGIGHVAIVLEYALLPLVLVFFMYLVKRKNGFKSLMLIGVLFTIANFYIALIALLLFCFMYGVYKRSFNVLIYSLMCITIVSFLYFLIQGNWAIPFAAETIHGLSGKILSSYFGNVPIRFLASTGYEISDSLRLIGTHMPYSAEALGNWSAWKTISLLPAILAFSSLILRPKDKRVIFFSALTIIGIALASAGSGPIGFLWTWLFENIPFLWIFRDPSRWYPLISLGYAVLLGLSSEILEQYFYRFKDFSIHIMHNGKTTIILTLSSSKAKVISLLLVIIIFLGSTFAYAYPFFTGDFGGQMQTYTFGEKYEQLWRRISTDPEDFRVFMLPAPYPTLYNDAKYSSTPGYDMMSKYIGKDFLYLGRLYSPRFETFLIKTLYENRTQRLADFLTLADIKYVIFDLNKSTTTTDHGPAIDFPEMSFTNDKLIKTLKQQANLEQSDTIGSIEIFTNENNLGHLFPVNQIGLFAGDLDGLVSLSYSENLENRGLIFVSQLTNEDLIALSGFPNVSVIIQDGHFLDLLLTAASKECTIAPVQYAYETSPDKGWTLMSWIWYDWHYQAQLDIVTYTFTPANLSIPYLADETGLYEVYLKTYFGPDASEINSYIDDSRIGTVTTKKSYDAGFRWSSFGSVYLNQGNHELRIESSNGNNAIASIAVIPKKALDEAKKVVAKLMEDRQVIILSELDWSEWEEKEESPFFAKKWDDEQANFWIVGYGGSGTLAVPTITTEGTIVKTGNASFKFSASSNGNYGYAAIDHTYSPSENWSKYDTFSLWWYGKNTGKMFAVRLEDSEGRAQEWRPIEDWEGWKRLVFSLRKPDAYWGTPANLSDITKVRISKSEAGDWYFDRGGLDFLYTKTGFEEIGVSASEGSALSTSFAPINQSVLIPKQGIYKIYIRAASGSVSSNMTIETCSSQFKIQVNPLANGFQWCEVGETNMSEGLSEIILRPSGSDRIYLDQLIIEAPTKSAVASAPVKIAVLRINPTKYEIAANATRPFYLFFSELCHQSWKIHLEDGTQIASYPAYSFGNLFFVNKTGTLNMILEFEEQRLYDVGTYVSLTLFIALVLLALTPSQLLRIPRRIVSRTVLQKLENRGI